MSAELVLILGAGASVPYGFPTGNVLKNWICDLRNHRGSDLGFYGSEINADYQRRKRVFEALKQLGIPEAEIENLGRMLAESKLPSIDRLVFHCGKEIGDVARLLIAAFLLDSESEIALQNPRAEGDWFSPLWSSLTAGRKSISEVVTDKLAVFTFNYDSSLEWLLFSACKATYGVDDKNAAEFLSGVHIEHFYGATTTLHQLNNAGVKFDCDRANLHLAVERAEQEIWLIDDDRKRQESVFANARQAIGEAKVATFLGYGFDEINDGKLGVAQLIAETKRDNIARAERLKFAPTIHHIPSGKVELDPQFIVPKERGVPRFQATTFGMYEREVTSALGRNGLSRGGRDGQISTLSKNCYEALREWGTFDLLR